MEFLVVEFTRQGNQPIDRGVIINDIHGSWRTNKLLFLAAGTYTIRLEPGVNQSGQASQDFSPPSVPPFVLQFTDPSNPKRIKFTSTVQA